MSSLLKFVQDSKKTLSELHLDLASMYRTVV